MGTRQAYVLQRDVREAFSWDLKKGEREKSGREGLGKKETLLSETRLPSEGGGQEEEP